MHITTTPSPKYEAMLGVRGGKDWGINEVGMKQMDDNIGHVLKKLEDMGELEQHDCRLHHRQRGRDLKPSRTAASLRSKEMKLTTWEGGMRAPCVIRWPGVIKPGTVFKEIFASLDRLPTFVDIAGGAKGNALEAGG